jgi:arylsulfatase A
MRYSFLIAVLIAGVSVSCNHVNRKHGLLPSIVLINVDDLGWTDASCLGSGYYETPNIDYLAAGGMRFTDFYAACALCSPTRASIMTGRYPSRIGITDWIRARFQPGGKVIPEENPSGYELAEGKNRKFLTPRNPLWMELEEVTIAEMLKKAGYTTCHIGKWHLGSDPWYPDKQGFDFNIGGCDYGEPPSYFDPYNRGPIPELYYDSIPGIPTLPPRKAGEYLTDRESDEAVKFIRDHRDGPFFLNMCHYAVHVPLQAKDSLVRKYRDKPPTNHKNPVYAAMVESVDDAVGRILTTLEELSILENTLVIFTSDNGGLTKENATDNSPLRSGKAFPYEGGIRIPLIVYWQGKVRASSTSSEPLCSIDFFPTICEIAGIDIPVDLQIDGTSFLVVLKEEQTRPVHDALMWHYPHYRDWDNTVPYSIIRKGDWKLIKWWDGELPYELYNLKSDLSETNNLALEMPGVVEDMNAELMKILAETHSKLPLENPDFRAGSE